MFIFYAQCGKLVRTPAVHNLTCMYIHTYIPRESPCLVSILAKEATRVDPTRFKSPRFILAQRGDPGARSTWRPAHPRRDSSCRRQMLRPHSSPSNTTTSLLAILLPQPCALLLENRRFQKLTCPHQHATGDNNSRGTSRRAPWRTSRRVPARASRRAPLLAGALTWLLFCGFLAGGAAECPAQNESSPSTMACDSANTACAPGDYCQNFSSAPCAFPLCRQQIVPMGGADLRKVRLPSEKPQLYALCAV